MLSAKGLGKRVLLLILDGFGINPNSPKNAIQDAKTPNIDKLFNNYPFTTIEASGESVGLPKGVMGNSEVGHLNLGSGKKVRQDLVRINEAIDNGSFKDLPKLQELIDCASQHSNRIHIMGLLSDGGVHSHINHLKEIIKILSSKTNSEIFFHAFMDGRDTQPQSGEKYIQEIQNIEGFCFASMQGRSIGMDRDRRWNKIEHAYNTMTGKGKVTSKPPLDYIRSEYQSGIFDEFITPTLFDQNGAITEDDTIFFINFRPDRAAQISMAFCDPNFTEFERNSSAPGTDCHFDL